MMQRVMIQQQSCSEAGFLNLKVPFECVISQSVKLNHVQDIKVLLVIHRASFPAGGGQEGGCKASQISAHVQPDFHVCSTAVTRVCKR